MDHLDAGYDEVSSRRQVVTVQSFALRWPVLAVLGLSGLGLLIAIFQSPLLSVIAYAVLLLVGCGLLFYRRLDAILATRRAGGVGVLTVQPIEKTAIAALAVSCLANGFVVALEVAGWEVWT